MTGPVLGWVQRFRPGRSERVEALLRELSALGVAHLRTGLSRALVMGDASWYDALLPRLAQEVDVLPCLRFAPGRPVDHLDVVLERWGAHFRWIELSCVEVDAALVDTLVDAVERVHAAGRRVVLGGVTDLGPDTVERLGPLLDRVDAVGLQVESGDCGGRIAAARDALGARGVHPEVWISRGGGRIGGGGAEVHALAEALGSSAQRVYWYGLAGDAHAPRGIARRILRGGGPARVRAAGRTGGPRPRAPYALVTGGAGFVGCNLAHRLLSEGRRVVVLDDLSRPGVERNARWLVEQHGDRVCIEIADIRDAEVLGALVPGADQVFHFAAQVAVTTSLQDPVGDFDVNARGTLCLLEALRALPDPPPLVFSSTNKVYGDLDDVALALRGERYEPEDVELRARGVDESRPLLFHSPYGCSKGAADQYVLDYARTFGLPAAVFRMSCVYGPRQFGTEDQGWVAHFLRHTLEGAPITVYGDGCQVRDVLYVDDLVDAFVLARDHMPALAGRAYNIGGGPENALSLRELLADVEDLCERQPQVAFAPWRPADQRYYVSDCRRFREVTGWWPRIPVGVGLARLGRWLREGVVPQGAQEAPALEGATP